MELINLQENIDKLLGEIAYKKEVEEEEILRLKELLKNNPNKIWALISTFSRFNQLRFHAADGSGYEFIAEQVLRLDPLNPQIAARLVSVFNNWKKFTETHKTKINYQLQKIVKTPKLSGDVFEIVSKTLN